MTSSAPSPADEQRRLAATDRRAATLLLYLSFPFFLILALALLLGPQAIGWRFDQATITAREERVSEIRADKDSLGQAVVYAARLVDQESLRPIPKTDGFLPERLIGTDKEWIWYGSNDDDQPGIYPPSLGMTSTFSPNLSGWDLCNAVLHPGETVFLQGCYGIPEQQTLHRLDEVGELVEVPFPYDVANPRLVLPRDRPVAYLVGEDEAGEEAVYATDRSGQWRPVDPRERKALRGLEERIGTVRQEIGSEAEHVSGLTVTVELVRPPLPGGDHELIVRFARNDEPLIEQRYGLSADPPFRQDLPQVIIHGDEALITALGVAYSLSLVHHVADDAKPMTVDQAVRVIASLPEDVVLSERGRDAIDAAQAEMRRGSADYPSADGSRAETDGGSPTAAAESSAAAEIVPLLGDAGGATDEAAAPTEREMVELVPALLAAMRGEAETLTVDNAKAERWRTVSNEMKIASVVLSAGSFFLSLVFLLRGFHKSGSAWKGARDSLVLRTRGTSQNLAKFEMASKYTYQATSKSVPALIGGGVLAIVSALSWSNLRS